MQNVAGDVPHSAQAGSLGSGGQFQSFAAWLSRIHEVGRNGPLLFQES